MKEAFYIKLYESYRELFARLTDAEVGKLARAMLSYGIEGISPEFSKEADPALYYTWNIYKCQIDRDMALHEKLAQRSRRNGRLGGRPKTRPAPEDTTP